PQNGPTEATMADDGGRDDVASSGNSRNHTESAIDETVFNPKVPSSTLGRPTRNKCFASYRTPNLERFTGHAPKRHESVPARAATFASRPQSRGGFRAWITCTFDSGNSSSIPKQASSCEGAGSFACNRRFIVCSSISSPSGIASSHTMNC